MTPVLLGRGPSATVYATTAAGQPAAVKVFPGKFDRRTLATIERERVKLTGLTASVPILPVDAVGQWQGKHALRMELCAESLAARVQRTGALDVEDVVELGHGLALALAAAHAAGVMHGGVSPHNVLFRASGEPVFADFGVSIRQAFRRDPLHSIECVSPETLRTGAVDERTDVYGLGAVLHFALTGQSPHPSRIGEQPGERVLRVLGEPVPAISRPDVPIGLSTVVARLLAADVVHRPDRAAWAVERLGAMLSRPAVEVPVPAPVKRFRPVYFVVAGVLAVCLALVGFFLWPRSGEVATPPAVTLDLAEPVVLGDHVMLTWASSQPLDIVVVIAPDGEPKRYVLTERNQTTARVPVDPARGYCFQIRGTNGYQVVESQTKPVRGAVCPR